jgi:hypothetical protein
MPRAFYDPSNPSTTTIYRVKEAGDPFFIPAYPIMDEEQQALDVYHSENGVRSNLEDGSNDPAKAPRVYGTACAFTEPAFDAYKAAALAQCQKIASSTAISATGIDPVVVNYEDSTSEPS